MNKDINTGSVLNTIWAGVTSGQLPTMALCGFLGTCLMFGAVAFYDGLNGRGCSSASFDDPFSWGKGLGCFSRGILEGSPRAKTQQKPRPN